MLREAPRTVWLFLMLVASLIVLPLYLRGCEIK
jgi:hypothetical protein